MEEKHSGRCHNCGAQLKSEKEMEMEICLECRRYGLLYGCWPKQQAHDSFSPSSHI
jgi:hypothetical protein